MKPTETQETVLSEWMPDLEGFVDLTARREVLELIRAGLPERLEKHFPQAHLRVGLLGKGWRVTASGPAGRVTSVVPRPLREGILLQVSRMVCENNPGAAHG